MLRKLSVIFAAILLLGSVRIQAQTQTQEKPVAELFCGAELSYSDVNFARLYNVLINLTPGTRVRLGHDWEVAGQLYLPIVNDGYEERYSMIRLNMANISKVFRYDEAKQYFKVTAGLFGKERYGGDLRWMYPVNSWLLLQARMGLTNRWALGASADSSESEFETRNFTFTAMFGANVWLQPWATELRASGGRYLNHDYGVEGEIIRHFKHCSVSAFVQYHELNRSVFTNMAYRYAGGFRVVMMLPPYKKKQSRVVYRPASNFRLTYKAQADGYSMRNYTTDPEENERTYPIDIPWGTGNFNE